MTILQHIIVLLFNLVLCHTACAQDNRHSFDKLLADKLGPIQLGSIKELEGFVSKQGSIDISNKWRKISFDQQATRKKIQIVDAEINNSKRKYKVLYRIDPRFYNPQIFIWQLDNATEEYVLQIVDKIMQYNPTALSNQDSQELIKLLDNHNKNNNTIPLENGDVVNVTIGDPQDIPKDIPPIFQDHYDDTNQNLAMLYLNSNDLDNKILFASSEVYCNTFDKTDKEKYCGSIVYDGYYYSYNTKKKELFGLISDPSFDVKKITPCRNDQKGLLQNNDKLCYYDKGRGVKITVGNSVKDMYSKMLAVPTENQSSQYIYYHYSKSPTNLQFSWDKDSVDGMFNTPNNQFKQYMEQWNSKLNDNLPVPDLYARIVQDTDKFLQTGKRNSSLYAPNKFLYVGRYIFDVEVGKGIVSSTTKDITNLNIEYIIMKNGNQPNNTSSGTIINKYIDIPDDGESAVWIRSNNNHVGGRINYKLSGYNGIKISETLNNYIIQPIQDRLSKTMYIIFDNLAQNAQFVRITYTLLILYIIFYGIYFTLGAAAFTAKELVIRVIKVIIIVQLLQPDSWKFFCGYLFDGFIKGIDYLMINATGASSEKGNMFAFIDPILQRYMNWKVWVILGIQLLQIFNGGFIIALMGIASIYYYVIAILIMISYYLVTFVSIAVMISIAPIFIVMILFEQTKSMFNNYISTLFSYMIQPTIMLVFILMLDKIVSYQLSNILVKCEWGVLFSLGLHFILLQRHIDIDLSDYIPIPFIFYWPFYIPSYNNSEGGNIVTVFVSALLLVVLSKMIFNIIGFVDRIMGQVANVALPRTQGSFRERDDAASSLFDDIHQSSGLEYIRDKGGTALRTLPGLEYKVGKYIHKKLRQTLYKGGKYIYKGGKYIHQKLQTRRGRES